MLDDIESRTGSTVSLLRTFIGLYLRKIGGWVATRELITLMEDVGIDQAATRNGITALKQKELLLPKHKTGVGYQLNPKAIPMLERGDERIFTIRQMQNDSDWLLISFSVAEAERAKRYQLRKRLQWFGCGNVAAGLWIAPPHLWQEIKQTLDHFDVPAVMFKTCAPELPGGFKNAVKKWWDLETIKRKYQTFIKLYEDLIRSGSTGNSRPSPKESFVNYLRLIDGWRPIPYLDPGLPQKLLPDSWPGQKAYEMFTSFRTKNEGAATEYVLETTKREG